MIKQRKDAKTRLITPESVRKSPEYHAAVISSLQGQSLYPGIHPRKVYGRIKQTDTQREEDLGVFDYCLLEHNEEGIVAVTSILTYTEDLPTGHKLNPRTVYLTKSGGTYTKKQLHEIVDTSPPIAEITGLARDKRYRGQNYGQHLSSLFTQYLEKNHEDKLITRFSLGKYAEGYKYSESKESLENLVENNDEITPEQLQNKSIPGLPYVHPISVPAAISARNQGYKAVAARIPNIYEGSDEGHGGPIWVPRDTQRVTQPIQHIPTILGKRDDTYETLK